VAHQYRGFQQTSVQLEKRALFPGVNGPELEVNLSPPPNTEFNNHSSICPAGECRNSFTFLTYVCSQRLNFPQLCVEIIYQPEE
jgi:hypothetical protein